MNSSQLKLRTSVFSKYTRLPYSRSSIVPLSHSALAGLDGLCFLCSWKNLISGPASCLFNMQDSSSCALCIFFSLLYVYFYFSVQTILEICFFLYLAFFSLLFWEIVSSSRVARSLERSRKCFPWIILNLLFASEIGSWMNYTVDIFGNNWLLNCSSRFNICRVSDLHLKFYYKQDLKGFCLFTIFFCHLLVFINEVVAMPCLQ